MVYYTPNQESIMSAGSPVIPVRIPTALLAQIECEIAKVNLTWNVEPYTRSSFIISAIKNRIDHLHRSRKKRKGAKKNLDTPPPATVTSTE